MNRQASTSKSQKPGQGLIRSGLSVQELKAITALRVGVAATEYGGDKASLHSKSAQSGVRSYQTANANQLVAAGMMLQSSVATGTSSTTAASASPTVSTSSSSLPSPSSSSIASNHNLPGVHGQNMSYHIPLNKNNKLPNSLALPLSNVNHGYGVDMTGNLHHLPEDMNRPPHLPMGYYAPDDVSHPMHYPSHLSPRGVASSSSSSSSHGSSPHLTPRRSNDISPQVHINMSQMNIPEHQHQQLSGRQEQYIRDQNMQYPQRLTPRGVSENKSRDEGYSGDYHLQESISLVHNYSGLSLRDNNSNNNDISSISINNSNNYGRQLPPGIAETNYHGSNINSNINNTNINNHDMNYSSPKLENLPYASTMLPYPIQNRGYNEHNLSGVVNMNSTNNGPPPGLKPVIPPLKAVVVPPLHSMSSSQNSRKSSIQRSEQDNTSTDYGMDTHFGQQQLQSQSSSLLPSAISPYRSPTQHSPYSQNGETNNLSGSTFLPSLNSPGLRSTSSVSSTNSARRSGLGSDFSQLERLHGNQFQHNNQVDNSFNSPLNLDKLNISPGGSLSNRITSDYPMTTDEGLNSYRNQKSSSNSFSITAPIGFRTGSETNLLAVEIAESILNAGMTPELNTARRKSANADSPIRPGVLSPISHDLGHMDNGIDSINTPGRAMKTNSSSDFSSSFIPKISQSNQVSRHPSLLKTGQQTPVISHLQKNITTPRELSPRITDGWLTGRLDEPNTITSPKSPVFSNFSSPLIQTNSTLDHQDNSFNEYRFEDGKDADSDHDSNADEGENDNITEPVNRSFIIDHLSGGNHMNGSINGNVTLPFKYESNFYQ